MSSHLTTFNSIISSNSIMSIDSIRLILELGAETYICRNMFRIRQCQNLVSELSLICRNPKPETNAESQIFYSAYS